MVLSRNKCIGGFGRQSSLEFVQNAVLLEEIVTHWLIKGSRIEDRLSACLELSDVSCFV